MNRLDCNPDDVELVRKTTPEGFGDWIAQKIEYEFAARKFLERIPAPRVLLSPLLDAMAAGDTLWLCRSKQRGMLHGNEGVALVREGQPILYLRVIQR